MRAGYRAAGARPAVIDLLDPGSVEPALTGCKAAAIARAATFDMPVLPGFVITTAAGPDIDSSEVRARWRGLSHGGEVPLVVRSSSTIEDVADSSMAGRFRSVLDVTGWDAFVRAVGDVRASAETNVGRSPAPMAVLVQPQQTARCGGVLFGIDPVTGDHRHMVVEVVEGGPESLVSGRATATRYLLTRRGRAVERDGGPLLRRRELTRLCRLARQTEEAFGGPQDIEWAIDATGHLHMFQSRPITALGAAADAAGPLLGPGPIAETFPDPLRRLERQLLLEPLREGIMRALQTLGTVPKRRLSRSPVATHVGGRVAADLELFGIAPVRRSPWRYLNPAPSLRHLAAAWRVGRLRRSLPNLAAEVVATIDRELAGVPAFATLSDRELLWMIRAGRRHLATVHGYEVLAGTLLRSDERGSTAVGKAVAAITAGRAHGKSDTQIVAALPEVLAIVPPRVPSRTRLPEVVPSVDPTDSGRMEDDGPLGPREALRLRSRWLQELLARGATELGERLARAERLRSAPTVRELTLSELAGLVSGDRAPLDLETRASEPGGPPLPVVFRLGPGGEVAPVRPRGGRDPQGGRGAGGGRRVGRVRQLSQGAVTERGEVLVVSVLEPGLAVALPRLGGLVAETGSTLSHLAILARESHVPTVVGVEDAVERFRPGMLVLVDGTTGEVRSIAEEAKP